MKQNKGNYHRGPRPKTTSTTRQQAALWTAIRACNGEWTAREIAERANVPRSTAVHYVTALARGGFVRLAREPVRTQAGALPAYWRLTPLGARTDAPPIVRHAGERPARAQA